MTPGALHSPGVLKYDSILASQQDQSVAGVELEPSISARALPQLWSGKTYRIPVKTGTRQKPWAAGVELKPSHCQALCLSLCRGQQKDRKKFPVVQTPNNMGSTDLLKMRPCLLAHGRQVLWSRCYI